MKVGEDLLSGFIGVAEIFTFKANIFQQLYFYRP